MADLRKLALSTGGGDAPGLNAVIRAATIAAIERGWECYGIREGYNGLLQPERFPTGGLIPLTRDSVRGITHLGGTILGTTNRGNPLRFPTLVNGQAGEVDRTDELVARIEACGLDALIAIGGDSSMAIADVLGQKGVRVVGVPKTIDNDLEQTVVTFGFDTAVAFATECLDRLHSTAQAHQRVIVVEVMGRNVGWIALNAGVAGTAHVILIPEIPYDLTRVAAALQARFARGRHYALMVVAEGARPIDGAVVARAAEAGHAEKLGGVGEQVAEQLRALTAFDLRTVTLGHLLRGGTPTSFDRLLSLRFGAAAVRALADGHTGVMVALDPPTVKHVPFAEVSGRLKRVPLDSDTMVTAREIGICFGD